VVNARQDIANIRDPNPSLAARHAQLVPRAYAQACQLASAETGLPRATFPESCPWTLAEILDDDFFPEVPDADLR
jgi:hypothetical protein